MKPNKNLRFVCIIAILIQAFVFTIPCVAQQSFMINFGYVEGVQFSKKDIMNYKINSLLATPIKVKLIGQVTYKDQPHKISYEMETTLYPGINDLSIVNPPAMQYSSSSLRTLFESYNTLPQGIFEYCVTIASSVVNPEVQAQDYSECVYGRNDDLFLINLVYPEDYAKIYEVNPMLSWYTLYPFQQELTYRIKLVEAKPGQNNTAAIDRNQRHYQESQVIGSSKVYPAYARPLEIGKQYVWTVDAYYKELLLGGAEPFRFEIVEDTLDLSAVPRNPSYIDLELESGKVRLFAPGIIKIKYELKHKFADTLQVELLDATNKKIKLPKIYESIPLIQGDNRIELNFQENFELTHRKSYTLVVTVNGTKRNINFIYINPDYLK